MTPQEDKYLRQLIRKDVKEIAKIQRYQDSDYSESDEEQRLEDKVLRRKYLNWIWKSTIL